MGRRRWSGLQLLKGQRSLEQDPQWLGLESKDQRLLGPGLKGQLWLKQKWSLGILWLWLGLLSLDPRLLDPKGGSQLRVVGRFAGPKQ